jgi:peptide deformylase
MPIDPARLHIVIYPHPALRQKAAEVDPSDEQVRAVAARMLELMYEADGVGLAAPQVGLAWRIFVTRGRDEDPGDRTYINPRMKLERGDLESGEEGCLSIPGISAHIRRANAIVIEALEGFPARVCQHEHDHLDGVLIIDRMPPLDRLSTRKKLKDLEAARVL